jgi:hypothetical protein
MKQLSRDVVNTVMEFLILTFGKTTTLDVKQNLRKLGFEASQSEVSDFMDEIFQCWEEDYSYELDGEEVELIFTVEAQNRKSFRVYSFSEIVPCDDEDSDDSEIEDELEDEVDIDPRTYIAQNINRPSSLLAQALGISVASVAAYKANLNR